MALSRGGGGVSSPGFQIRGVVIGNTGQVFPGETLACLPQMGKHCFL